MVQKRAEWKDCIMTMLLVEAIPFYSSHVYLRPASTTAFFLLYHTRLVFFPVSVRNFLST